MKKTLLITLDFYPTIGGVATYYQRLGEHLPASQWIVLAPHLPGDLPELLAPYRIIRRNLVSRFLFPHWLGLFWHILTLCKKERIERIVVGNILPVGTVVWIFSWFYHVPYGVSTHGFDVARPRLHRRKKWLCANILKSAQWVVVNSKATAQIINEYGVLDTKIQFVYPCPSITPALLLQQSSGEPLRMREQLKDKKIILTVGRLVQRKGHAHVLRALPGILAEIPDSVYCIIGSGPYRGELEKLVYTLNLDKKVFFLGSISSPELAHWYAACSVFIMTPEDIDGDIEGFGIVYLEAQSFGKPVIGSRVSGVAEAVVDGVTGILVPERNSLEIQKTTIRLLSDSALAHQLGDAGRHRVAEEFQWKHQAEKLQYLLSL